MPVSVWWSRLGTWEKVNLGTVRAQEERSRVLAWEKQAIPWMDGIHGRWKSVSHFFLAPLVPDAGAETWLDYIVRHWGVLLKCRALCSSGESPFSLGVQKSDSFHQGRWWESCLLNTMLLNETASSCGFLFSANDMEVEKPKAPLPKAWLSNRRFANTYCTSSGCLFL